MAGRRMFRGPGHRTLAARLRPHLTSQLTLAGLALLAAAPLILAAVFVPRPLVLPILSLAAIAIAALAAFAAWILREPPQAGAVTLWDIAGAFTLIGCAAAMFSEPENLLQAFGQP